MPLSDDEQRILLEIEKEFYDSDPKLAREVGETSLYKHSLRNIKWAVCIGVLGLVIANSLCCSLCCFLDHVCLYRRS